MTRNPTPAPALAAWGSREWMRWAGGELEAEPPLSATQRSPTQAAPAPADTVGGGPGGLWRVIVAVIGVGLLSLGLALLPYRLPGESVDAELRPVDAGLCTACKASQQIVAVGLQQLGSHRWLTVRLAAPPADARFDVMLNGGATPLSVAQGAGGAWTVSVPRDSDIPLPSVRIGTRGDRVVLELPFAASDRGVAVRSVEGRVFPASGVLAFPPSGPRSFNVIDLVVLGAALAGAWAGYRAGATLGFVRLVALVIALAIARALAEPAARLLGYGQSEASLAFAFGVLTALAGLVLYLIAGRVAGRLWAPGLQSAGRVAAERALGWPIGVLQALVLAAMVLSLGSDLALLDALHRSIETSLLGNPLASLWRAVMHA